MMAPAESLSFKDYIDQILAVTILTRASSTHSLWQNLTFLSSVRTLDAVLKTN